MKLSKNKTLKSGNVFHAWRNFPENCGGARIGNQPIRDLAQATTGKAKGQAFCARANLRTRPFEDLEIFPFEKIATFVHGRNCNCQTATLTFKPPVKCLSSPCFQRALGILKHFLKNATFAQSAKCREFATICQTRLAGRRKPERSAPRIP